MSKTPEVQEDQTTTDDFPVESRDGQVEGVGAAEAAEAILEVATVIPRRTRTTQAEWDARRKESKTRAEVTIKANAKKAEAAKKRALAKAPVIEGQKAFYDKAQSVQEHLDARREATK